MGKKMKNIEKAQNTESKKQLRQNDIPKFTIENSLKIIQALWDQFAGSPTPPLLVAQAIGISPSSSNWRYLTGSSVAYGLTEGGYNAKEIVLTELGRKIVAPTEEGEDALAIVEAALKPSISRKFYEKYGNSNKLPNENIAINLLTTWGIPKNDADKAYKIIYENGLFANIIINIQGNQYVNLDNPTVNKSEHLKPEIVTVDDEETELPDELLEKMNIKPAEEIKENIADIQNNKVFISHGKNRQIVEQLKQLLEFGAFEPVVSIERETTAISVPEKVFNDMRMCKAGVIHIEGENTLMDRDGNVHSLINENVLIEIGAAIALFKNRVILLCKKETNLPSNLQGLYRCEYDGDQLDYQSTMKLLKTFSEFRKNS